MVLEKGRGSENQTNNWVFVIIIGRVTLLEKNALRHIVMVLEEMEKLKILFYFPFDIDSASF